VRLFRSGVSTRRCAVLLYCTPRNSITGIIK
jgi:hypothetical protein